MRFHLGPFVVTARRRSFWTEPLPQLSRSDKELMARLLSNPLRFPDEFRRLRWLETHSGGRSAEALRLREGLCRFAR